MYVSMHVCMDVCIYECKYECARVECVHVFIQGICTALVCVYTLKATVACAVVWVHVCNF